MTKPLISLLTVFGIALGTATTASADEAGFIEAVDSVGRYSTVYPDETVEVGHRVCKAFDSGSGGKTAAVQEVLTDSNADTSEFADYYTTLFAQSAANELCPAHQGEIGQI